MINTDIDKFLQEMLDNKSKFDIGNYANQLNQKELLIIEDGDKNDHWIQLLPNVQLTKIDAGHNFIDQRIRMINEVVDWLN